MEPGQELREEGETRRTTSSEREGLGWWQKIGIVDVAPIQVTR